MPGKLAVLGGLNLCGEQQFPFFKYNEFGIFDVALFKKLSVVGDGHCTVLATVLYYNCYCSVCSTSTISRSSGIQDGFVHFVLRSYSGRLHQINTPSFFSYVYKYL